MPVVQYKKHFFPRSNIGNIFKCCLSCHCKEIILQHEYKILTNFNGFKECQFTQRREKQILVWQLSLLARWSCQASFSFSQMECCVIDLKKPFSSLLFLTQPKSAALVYTKAIKNIKNEVMGGTGPRQSGKRCQENLWSDFISDAAKLAKMELMPIKQIVNEATLKSNFYLYGFEFV